jgi:O-antigen/teichoic acid export membrane protein
VTHVDQPSLRSQAVTGVMWTALQKWSVRLSTFVAFLLLGRLLAPADFGVVALAMSFIVLLTVLADAGFATYLVQAQDLTEDAKNTAFYIATAAGVVLALVVAALSFPAATLLDVPELRRVLPALAVALVFVGLSSVPAALLQRELRFQQLAMRQVVATVVSVLAAVGLALAGAGLWALVAQTLVRHAVASTILMLASDFRPRWAFARHEVGPMVRYSSKAMGAQMLAQSREQGEVLLIGAIAGPVALGLWTVAGRLVNVLTDLLGTVVGTVAVPLFARVQGDPARLGRAVSATAGVGSLVLAPALAALALLSPELVTDVFGDQWDGAALVAAVLAMRGLLIALAGLDRSVLLNTGHAGGELRVIAGITAVHVVLVATLAPFGIEVLAVAVLVEAVVFAPLRPYLLHRWVAVPYSSYTGVSLVILSAATAGLTTLLSIDLLDLEGLGRYVAVLGGGGVAYVLLVSTLAHSVVKETLAALRLLRQRRRPQPTVVVASHPDPSDR